MSAATKDHTTAARYVERLYANGTAKDTRQIDYAEWTRRQLAVWDAIHARGERFENRVHALLRSH